MFALDQYVRHSGRQSSCKSHVPFKLDCQGICNSAEPLKIIRSGLKHQANQGTLMYDILHHTEVLKWATSLLRRI